MVDFGDAPIYNLTLSFFVIDIEGDGEMGRGDSTEAAAANSTEFPSDVASEFVMWIGKLAIYGTEHRMSFWCDDGALFTGDIETSGGNPIQLSSSSSVQSYNHVLGTLPSEDDKCVIDHGA